MKVYSVNKAIGYASSGVEYAQKYRRELFEDLDIDDQYIFLDYLNRNISTYTDLLGFRKNQIIWIYNFLSNRPTQPSTFTIEMFLDNLIDGYETLNQTSNSIDVKLNNAQLYKIWFLKDNIIDRVDYIVNGRLIHVEHYDKSLNNIEHYHLGQIVKRTFFDLNGKKSYEQFYKDKEILCTQINDQIIYGKMSFYQYFFSKLCLSADDAVIIDRPLDVIEGVLPYLYGKVRIFSVIHAEHYNKKLSTKDNILWNNNYEYILENSYAFESIIVSTDRQKNILRQQLKNEVNVVTIPVGYIKETKFEKNFNSYSLITASRLATEKHIDTIIRGVVLAKKEFPEIYLDIYGEGGEKTKLEELIKKNEASSYIKLCGHRHDIQNIYPKYSAYVSASMSEGFGLSLLEALGSGLPLIGIDVEYGNKEFIDNGKNGLLYNKINTKEMFTSLSEAICSFYAQNLDRKGRELSKSKSMKYIKENVVSKWDKLLNEGENINAH